MNGTPRTHEEFLALLERGEVGAVEGNEEARAEARRLILEATGTSTLEHAHEVIRSGRPRVGSEQRQPSKKLQVRVTDKMENDLTNRAQAEGRNRSDLVRDALSMYLYGTESQRDLVTA